MLRLQILQTWGQFALQTRDSQLVQPTANTPNTKQIKNPQIV